jgi:uncharacterized protein (DUF427 family)
MTENIHDYPRPPRLESSTAYVVVEFNNLRIADSRRSIRVLEKGHPPTWYVPPEDVRVEYLMREPYSSICEWKGLAHYYQLNVDGVVSGSAAWCYAEPTPEFAAIKHYIAFYPARVGKCTVDGEIVIPEADEFHGGWITSDITGVATPR